MLNKRKRYTPDMSTSSKGDKYVTQRVLSAKTHRVKQLQNQLADAHYHLQVHTFIYKFHNNNISLRLECHIRINIRKRKV